VTLTDISLSICGHAWHGKSTLLGKIVAECGMASPREIENARRQAKEGRDPSLVFAQLVFRSKDVDHKESEAARGVTILPSMVRFEFDEHRITVIDTPGQETYANNRFFGMFQADCAVMVVDVKEGPQPITRQVVRILKGFEIPLMAVALTKMDKIGYEEERFHEAEEEVRLLCEEHGLSLDDTVFIPCSAYAPDRDIHAPGEGILGFDQVGWYSGPSMYEFMSKLSYRRIRPGAPCRVVIHGSEVYDHVPGIGKTATALVEAGTIRPEMKLHFEPLSAERGAPVTARVRSVQLTRGHIATPGIPVPEGTPRQLVGIALKNANFKDTLRDLFKGRGVIAGEASNPPSVAKRMLLEITVFDPDTVLRVGEVWTMHVHVDRVAISLDTILSKRSHHDDDWVETEEDGILPTEWAQVEVTCTNRPVAIEEAETLPQLSKFVVRHGRKAVAYGRCVKILS
jgi:translation elongation factor EF-1alpha